MKTIKELPVCVIDEFYTFFKKVFLVFHTALLKCFIYGIVGLLDSSLRNNLPFCLNLFTIYCTQLPAKNITARKVILTSILFRAFAKEWTYIGL